MLQFEGEADMSFAGKVSFTGYKIPGQIGPMRKEWEHYSNKVWEEESVSRWR
jgi:hypothetical protein